MTKIVKFLTPYIFFFQEAVEKVYEKVSEKVSESFGERFGFLLASHIFGQYE